jgi:thiamine biosynthesis lipoprotein
MGSVLSIWHKDREEGKDNPNAKLPPMEKLQEAAKHTNINDVIIDTQNSTVYLADPKMTLDVGAIAKGYAVEQIAKVLEEKGVTGYILNVGGNIRTIGTKGDGTPWLVGIENPGLENEEAHIAYLNLQGEALVTSGSYQRYYTVDGVDYHHIIDPRTLMPGTNFRSVSIICKHSGLGDGLSTAVFTMSYEEGYALIESLDGVEAMWVLPNGEKKFSSGFNNYAYEKK